MLLGCFNLSRWDKLIDRILARDLSLRFEELAKVLKRMGYTSTQPRGGSSHYIFRKAGKLHIALPKTSPMDKRYVEKIRNIIVDTLLNHESEE